MSAVKLGKHGQVTNGMSNTMSANTSQADVPLDGLVLARRPHGRPCQRAAGAAGPWAE